MSRFRTLATTIARAANHAHASPPTSTTAASTSATSSATSATSSTSRHPFSKLGPRVSTPIGHFPPRTQSRAASGSSPFPTPPIDPERNKIPTPPPSPKPTSSPTESSAAPPKKDEAATAFSTNPADAPKPATPPPPSPNAIPALDPRTRLWDSTVSGDGPKHDFSTYDMMQRLQFATFTPAQSEALVKAMKSKLRVELENAKGVFLDKSRSENESYLFHAAASELRNEIFQSRRAQVEEMRRDRAKAQAEFDDVNTRFTEEVASFKNELTGMFNERKMETRAEQRAMENKIQELNYKITVLIKSELKSDVEALRWITTRRALMAIAFLAIFIVATIKVSKNIAAALKEEEEKEKDSANHSEFIPNEGTPAVQGVTSSLG
ncbi:hypothetical protein BJ508DRAFT_410717 [Ascobolus immersus RN42]|uniref:DUF1640-domain-containing protein n=1 Tax=Ascobolus immersus RN42 TaxID=1160509 RepID=A0A3N4IM18_ASCIM|nr:hypothetical protein BJ508DRAFT_410717 [Ascobolus immersus RN42]